MALRFVAIDPDTNGGNCPSVWIDESTGDLIVQGWEVIDEETLAEIRARSPIARNEKVVRMPARMLSIFKEVR